MSTKNPGTAIVTKIIFPVADMVAATTFYRSLGFEVDGYDDGYAFVVHNGQEVLHLATAESFDPSSNRAAGYFHVRDAADWHAAWSAAGLAVSPLQDHPWQMREFTITDPSGNLLRIGQNL